MSLERAEEEGRTGGKEDEGWRAWDVEGGAVEDEEEGIGRLRSKEIEGRETRRKRELAVFVRRNGYGKGCRREDDDDNGGIERESEGKSKLPQEIKEDEGETEGPRGDEGPKSIETVEDEKGGCKGAPEEGGVEVRGKGERGRDMVKRGRKNGEG
ncbi:hypothetical protein BC829DRAFT_417660 [Chytridium lagenaria]|nr:hypothetical protein BC829DRAFT_417660 [Chytridium lagenaria]